MPLHKLVCQRCGKEKMVEKQRKDRGKHCSNECRFAPFKDRFTSYYSVNDDGCWIWTKNKDKKGYGRVRHRGKDSLAHRASWIEYKGEIPDGMCVLHNCPSGDNPSCVNPGHLFLGTVGDNNKDMVAKKRGRYCHGSKNPSAKLTEHDVIEIRKRYASGDSSYKIAKDYPVRHSTIYAIAKMKKWKTTVILAKEAT